ncbi:O-antigen biosynthesis protein WlbC [Parasphingorhabdus litoris]|uniref:O-antigen biosynthesis protein WlbC n=2 Tax=Parasphingorhabdus litoris TaxID=394733 RepID=A0ABN1AFY4_9SPHN
MGPEVKQLEETLSAFVNVKHCITVSSGTDALLIALMALKIGVGDEVITTPFTFIATAEVIALLGATPVFVDVDPNTANLDVLKVEDAITDRTKAIIPVSLYGQCCDMDHLNAIAKAHNLPVIEDAAQSFGATYKGRRSCSLSEVGCTSFFPSKPLGCYGDGGAIFTNDDSMAQTMREIRVHGQSKRYVHDQIGIGGRMDTLQCAIVLAKFPRFVEEIEMRQAIARRYDSGLASLSNRLKRIEILPENKSVYGQYTVKTDDRENVVEALSAAGVPTAIHYPVPLNEQSAYQHYAHGNTPNSSELSKQVISLPMSADLRLEDQDYIISTLQEVLS